ncbi:MAG TPA: SpoIIE family protein phosphatase [Leptospiraceae bacterium]|nr:SpoIIE family protein phosphatase [Leptospiraceae bacterium]HMW06698.1 SpoIIE family protein phosphatase [Leptospiraceae bacterium]HMX31948.1 SpoIIE family protein phosphatase [Leptospiraceae bacterium]HMY33619.1 SpoIIE family protein phosphatase [Leptospiraceae bacterium]HNA05318.1 SpoIIE family protein phosphatase [Leptospiraceae bacterium]
MKPVVLVSGITKVTANQIKKDLQKKLYKDSFVWEYVESLNAKIKSELNYCSIIIWQENNNDSIKFEDIKQRFPSALIFVIVEELSEFIIDGINDKKFFKVVKNNFDPALLVRFIEEGFSFWNEQRKNEKQNKNIEKETLKKELEIAQEIQKNLLPNDSIKWKNLELECFSESAKNVGGDFYTYYGMQNDRALISKHIVAVGDVSGKGISAALIMATAISHIDNSMQMNLKLSDRAVFLDKLLTPLTKPQRQNCAVCLVEFVGVNTNRAFIKVVNAAFIPPYLKRKNGEVEWIASKGFALGQGLGMQFGYKEMTVGIEKGDIIVLVSDGIIEANNEINELLGFERFYSILEEAPNDSAKKMLSYIQKKISQYTNDSDQNDDRTIVVIRFH